MLSILDLALLLSGVVAQASPAPTVAGGWSLQACDPGHLSESDDECSSVGGWTLHKDKFGASTNLSVLREGRVQLTINMGYQTTLSPTIEWFALHGETNSWAVLLPYAWEDEDPSIRPHKGVLMVRLSPSGTCGVGVVSTILEARNAVATKVRRFKCPQKKCDYQMEACPGSQVGRFDQRWPQASVEKPPPSKAQLLNEQGLAARKAGQHLRAAKAYKEALQLDASHVWARYNLACELAVLGEHDAALLNLEVLTTLNDPEARQALRAAREDADFKKLRSNPKFVRLTN